MPRPVTPPGVLHLNKEIGQRVAHRRKALGLSVDTLETALDLARGALGRIERGDRGLDAGLIYGLCVHLEVPVDYFFEDLTVPGKASNIDLPSAQEIDDLLEFLNQFHAIPSEDERRQLAALVRALADGQTK